MRIITSIIFLFIGALLYGQNRRIPIGTWIKTNMESYSGNSSTIIEERNKTYLKYTFEKNNQMFISSDEQDKGSLLKYTFKRGIIDLGFNKYKIEQFTGNELVLIEYSGKNPLSNSTRIFLKREQFYLDSLQVDSDATFLKGTETIYFESKKVYPKFIHKKASNLNDFLQPYLENLTNDKEHFVYANFIVDTKGEVSDIQIHHHINKKFDKGLKKAIRLTSGKWEAPIINKKKVRVLKEIEIHYIEFPKMKKQNGDLVISPSKLISDEYIVNFKMAVQEYYLGKFSTALEKLPRRFNIESQKMNLAYFKSIVYKALDDNDNYEKYRMQLKGTKFRYLIDN